MNSEREVDEAVHWTETQLVARNHRRMTGILSLNIPSILGILFFTHFFLNFSEKWVSLNCSRCWRYQDLSYWHKEQKKRDRHKLLTLTGFHCIFNLRKIDLKLVFCYISSCNFFEKLRISHLLSIKNEKNNNVGLYDHKAHF